LLGELSERIFLSGGSVLTREDLSLNSHREKVDRHPEEKVRDGLPRALQERLEFPTLGKLLASSAVKRAATSWLDT
jgi:hypothetical protein